MLPARPRPHTSVRRRVRHSCVSCWFVELAVDGAGVVSGPVYVTERCKALVAQLDAARPPLVPMRLVPMWRN